MLTSGAATDATLARLSHVPGLDVVRALAGFPGKPDKYIDLLTRFVESHADDIARLNACLASGDLTAAQRLMHTLKGTGGTLGADHLVATAASLESVLRSSPDRSTSEEDFLIRLEAVSLALASLVAALPPRSAGSP